MNLKIKDLASDIACGGVPFELARHRVNHFAKTGLLRFTKDGENTSALQYGPEDAAIAILLSALTDMGVADLNTLRAAALQSYLAVDRCLAGLAKGQSWTLVSDVYRHAELGIFRNVRLSPLGSPARCSLEPAWAPRGALVIVVDEMMRPVLQRIALGKLN